jgi:hypothetical protein
MVVGVSFITARFFLSQCVLSQCVINTVRFYSHSGRFFFLPWAKLLHCGRCYFPWASLLFAVGVCTFCERLCLVKGIACWY